MLSPGQMLQNRYRIVRNLGGGGMGTVYLAEDIRLANKLCAVKELLPDPRATLEEQMQAAEQFQREAAILAHLSHPNLPNVYDYFEEANQFYLVMDYIEGETLADRLRRSPQGLPPEEVAGWGVQLCNVLEYLHSQHPPVIFRDMKPANVMVTPQGEVKLIDFGVARLFDPGKRTDTLKMGTAGYAPPEQYAGQGQTTPRSDLYALGVTLHELLTGDDPTAHPFTFTPPHQLNRAISPALSAVVMRAVQLDPAARYPSARAFREALEKTTHRRLRLPTVQQSGRTGTAVMAPMVAVPARRPTAPLRILTGLTKGILRLILNVLLAILVTVIVLGLVGTLLLSLIAQYVIANADWGLSEQTPGHSSITETELNEGMALAMEPYMLGVVQQMTVDFMPPDRALLSVAGDNWTVILQGRLQARNGAPMVIVERLNGVPLYIVGGLISGGINRGFQQAWQDAPVKMVEMNVFDQSIVVTFK
ncbi:MAG: serine/threonine protein kinase [Anaerolineae bacterium]